MKKPLLVALFAAAAFSPLGAAQASGGVMVSVSTTEFGFRFGAPLYGPPVYGPVYAPATYAPPVYAPRVVVVGPPRLIYRPPVVIAPRIAYAPAYVPRPHLVYPRVVEPRYSAPHVQRAAYRIPPGHAKGHKHHGHDD